MKRTLVVVSCMAVAALAACSTGTNGLNGAGWPVKVHSDSVAQLEKALDLPEVNAQCVEDYVEAHVTYGHWEDLRKTAGYADWLSNEAATAMEACAT